MAGRTARPSEPVNIELLLAAEHIINHLQRLAAAALMPHTTVKLALPGIPSESVGEAADTPQARSEASNTDEPDLS